MKLGEMLLNVETVDDLKHISDQICDRAMALYPKLNRADLMWHIGVIILPKYGAACYRVINDREIENTITSILMNVDNYLNQLSESKTGAPN